MYCDPILITWWHYCCCQTKQDGSRQYENPDTIEPESHQGLSKPHQDLGRNVHGSPSYVDLPEQPPHTHTERQDKDGYSQSVYDHVSLPEQPPHSDTEQQDKYGYSQSVCDDVSLPEQPPHTHTEQQDKDGYLQSVCDDVSLPEQPPHTHTEQQDKDGYSQSVCDDVSLPEQPPHIHTELQDKYGYSESVCVHDNEHTRSGQYENVNPTESESHSGQPRPHQDAAVDVDDFLPYVNMPEERSHSHSDLTDIDG